MSTSSDDTRRARRLLKALRAGTVPDPGGAYWASFAARLRRRLAEDEGARRAALRPPPRRAAVAGARLALGLAASLVLAGLLWQAAGSLDLLRGTTVGAGESARPAGSLPAVAPDYRVAGERLEALPAEVLDRALDEVVGSDGDDTGGAVGLSEEERRRLLEALRLEVAETSPPQARHSTVPEARLS